jgi:ribosome-binding protein aMBF1 (putative translation factor)
MAVSCEGGEDPMTICDLCGQSKDCSKKQIEGKEYDICGDCWNPLAEKLKGKGRVTKEREMVLLPPLGKEPEQPAKPMPPNPPKIWGSAERQV